MTQLPNAIVNQKRTSAIPAIHFLVIVGGMMLCLPGMTKGETATLATWLGGVLAVGGLVSFAIWAVRTARKVEALMNSLTQAELMSMIGRDHDTWIGTESVVRALNRRFPNWREGGAA